VNPHDLRTGIFVPDAVIQSFDQSSRTQQCGSRHRDDSCGNDLDHFVATKSHPWTTIPTWFLDFAVTRLVPPKRLVPIASISSIKLRPH
jgi:hypothetical protein